jgi:hypothetical protein
MANYYATARSNYFKVKDIPAFELWCAAVGLEVIRAGGENDPELVGFLDRNPDGGGFPSSRYGDDDELIEIDLAQELAAHLQDGWVAVLMEAGAEKHRYIIGWALAVNSKGEHEEIGLGAIYELAKELGDHITKAEY